MSKPSHIRITCKRYTRHNRQYTDKLFARVTPDALSVWCRWCDRGHLVSRAECQAVWETEGSKTLPILCSVIGPCNPRGIQKNIARIYFGGAFVWCKYCCRMHHLSKERCIQAWEALHISS